MPKIPDHLVWRYRHDPAFRTLVDSMVVALRTKQFTAEDLDQAAQTARYVAERFAGGQA